MNKNYKIKIKGIKQFDQILDKYKKKNPESFIPHFSKEEKENTHSLYLYNDVSDTPYRNQKYVSVMYNSLITNTKMSNREVEEYFQNHKNKEISFEEYMGVKEKTLL